MNRIQKFETFLTEIHSIHDNKTLIESVIEAYSAIFEAEKEEPEESGRAGIGPSGHGNLNTQDNASRTNNGVYGNKKENRGVWGKDSVITGGNWGYAGENKKVNELGQKELQAFSFNENSFKDMDKDLVDQLKSLIEKQNYRPNAFGKDDMKDIGTYCYRIIKSGNQGMVNAEKATKGVIETHEDVATVIHDLNNKLTPFFTKEASTKTDDELYDDVQNVIRPVLALLKKASDASYREVEKVAVAQNEEYKNFRGGMSEQEGRAKGLDINLVNETSPYYQLGLKYSDKLKNAGGAILGSNTDAIINNILSDIGENPGSEIIKELFKAFKEVKNAIDSKVNATVFKNAGPITAKVGESYNNLGNMPVKWEDLYEGKGKQQSLVSNFNAFNTGAYNDKLATAVNTYASLLKKASKDPSVKIPNVINTVPIKFVKLYYSLIKSGIGADAVNAWLKNQTKFIMDNAAVNDETLTETFNKAKEAQLSKLKEGSLLRKVADQITFDASAYKKLIVKREEQSDVA